MEMIKNFHRDILQRIKKNSGKPTKHTFSDSYLGNNHVRYPIAMPALRAIARDWMQAHRDLNTKELVALLTAMIEGESSTEKCMAGIMLGYATAEQKKFHPEIFDSWLDHLIGWVEVDSVCTGDYTKTQVHAEWPAWKKLLAKLSKDSNINKRRASLVFLCSPISRVQDDRMADTAFRNIDRLKSEKAILITKAISWLLRSMIRHYREEVSAYMEANAETLPKIAVRETRVKLETGKKTKRALKR